MARSGAWQIALALALVSLAGMGPARSAVPARIAFAVDTAPDGRTSRIYVANPDGTGVRPVSTGQGRDRAPAFSPDGTRLAYQTSNDLGLDTVVVQPLDGGPARTLATGAFPQWSQDGHQILFSRRQLNEYLLYAIRADASQKESDLKPIAKGAIGRWSPDERRLAAVAPAIVNGQDRWQLQITPAGDKEPNVKLTLPETYGQVVSLEWSPDGQRLLFSVSRGAGNALYAVDLKAPDPKRLPRADEVGYPNAAFGSWSPDGKTVLFRAASETAGSVSRLCTMHADGTAPKVLWEPENKALRIGGTAWYHPLAMVVKAPVKQPEMPSVTIPPKAPPIPAPEPPKVAPMPAPMPPRVLGPPKKLYSKKEFVVDQGRSPVSVRVATPGDADFVINVPVLPQPAWAPRRQGVGITLELEDGSLYRGTVIYSGTPWVTLQGRPKGGKVHLIDGKQLTGTEGDFKKGFRLTVRREAGNLILAVNDQDILTRGVLSGPIKSLALTLEDFDPGPAHFPIGNVYYRRSEEATATTPH